MSVETSLIQLFLIGAGSLAGYLGRIFQKFDDKKDGIYLEFLPSLNYSFFSYKESVRFFLDDTNLTNLKKRIQEINTGLNTKVFSGDILFLEEDLRNVLLDFYNDSKNFEHMLDKLTDNNATSLKSAFEKEETLVNIQPAKLLKDAENIRLIIESELKKYQSISLYLILIISLLGAAVVVFESLRQ